MTSPRERLANVRRLYRDRADGGAITVSAYTVYLTVLGAAVAGFPVVRALLSFLADDESARLVLDTRINSTVSAVAGGALVLLSVLGSVRGPALLSPFLILAVVSTGLRQRQSLLYPLMARYAAIVTASVCAAAVIGGALLARSYRPLSSVLALLVAGSAFAVIAVFVWLSGQVLENRSWVLTAVLLTESVLAHFFPSIAMFTPQGWLGQSWPNAERPWGWVILLALAAALTGIFSGRLLDLLHQEGLLRQALRWQLATTSVLAADAALALGAFRAQPVRGRRWRAVRGAPAPVQFLVRDVIGTLRNPGRVMIGGSTLIFASALQGHAGDRPWLGLVSGWIGFLAMGVFSDGLRHAAEAAGSPALYGYSTERLFLLHSGLPSVAGGVAAIIALVFDSQALGSGSNVNVIAVLVLPQLLAIVRAYDSVRGSLPLSLLTPLPTPFGDVSVLVVLGWQADALVLALGIGVALSMSTQAGAIFAPVATAGFAACAVAILARRRLRNLR